MKIHVIPTDKPSFGKYLVINKKGKLCIWSTDTMGSQITLNPQNIYITNDEKPKDGDWVLGGLNDIVVRWKSHFTANWKKVILTTDQYLYGVQAIDDEFLNWFVNNPGCEEVGVENSSVVKEHIFDGSNDGEVIWEYKIIIPKEEPKQELLPDFKITKNIFDFVNNLSDTKEEPIHLLSCCKSLDECHCGKYPKQETLEEATEIYVNKYYSEEGYKRDIEESIKFGAKWQESQMYGEEEVGELVYNIIGEYGKHYGIMIDGSKLNELFKQFKKK